MFVNMRHDQYIGHMVRVGALGVRKHIFHCLAILAKSKTQQF